MKVIIAGSREIADYMLVLAAVKGSEFNITEVVSGGAAGVDALGERYAREFNIPLKIFKADWNTYGRAAGPIRNKEMALYADALIAVWDGKSTGTQNMIQQASLRGLKTYTLLGYVNITEQRTIEDF